MKTLRELQEQAPTRDELRFWMRVHEIGDCWFFGIGKPYQYGAIRINGVSVPAHRYSYEITKGPIPEGLIIRHACDIPRCVRPEHLDVGTLSDNSRDIVARGRSHWRREGPPDKPYMDLHLKLPPELRDDIAGLANEHGRSLSKEIEWAIERHIEREMAQNG